MSEFKSRYIPAGEVNGENIGITINPRLGKSSIINVVRQHKPEVFVRLLEK